MLLLHGEISDRPIDDHTEYNAAWVTDDDYHWVCSTCLEDFRARLAWLVETTPDL